MTIYRDNLARPGQPLSASGANEAGRLTAKRIRGGPGVRISQTGDNVCINANVATARGGGLSIPWVAALPAIPTSPQTTRLVYWATSTQIEGATGDGQVWCASTGDTHWYPLQKFTEEDGAV